MKHRIYGIKNCDTMKKAFAWLQARNIDYEFHDYKKDGVPAAKLKEWAKRAGWEKLANSRGPTWRKIPEAQKKDLDESRALALLLQHSSAIRRPVLEAQGRLLIGFDPSEYEAALG
jgi:arsenate reductase (glutaredoxin)